MQRQTKAHVIEKEKKGHMEGIHLCRTAEGNKQAMVNVSPCFRQQIACVAHNTA
jgi:hypothetical protein